MTSTPRAMNTATVNADGTAVVDLDGQIHELTAPSIDQARTRAMALAQDHARTSGQPVLIFAQDLHAQHLLEVHPDGAIRPVHAGAEPSRGTAPGTPPRRRRWLVPVAVLLVAATALACTATRPWTGSDHQHAATSPSPSPSQPQPARPAQADAVVDAGTASSAPPRPPDHRTQPRWIAAASWEKARAASIQARERARAATQSPPGSGTRKAAPVAAPARPAVPPPAARPQSPPRQPDRPSVIVNPDEPSAVIEPAPPDTQTLSDSRLDPTNPDAG